MGKLPKLLMKSMRTMIPLKVNLKSDDEFETEAYELRPESINNALNKNTTIALYSASNSLELFYLCRLWNS